MALFAALAPQLLGAGISLLGSKMGNKQQAAGAQSAVAAGQQYVPEEVRNNLNAAGEVGASQLGLFERLQEEADYAYRQGGNRQTGRAVLERDEMERLQELRRPSIDRARAQLQSQLLSRGRLGVGTGGGRTGSLFNTQRAALEEAIMQAQLGDVGVAQGLAERRGRQEIEDFRYDRNFDVAQQQRALGNASGLFALQSRLISPGSSQAGAMNQAGMARASSTRGFFGGLANAVGSGSFFSGGAAPAAPHMSTTMPYTDSYGYGVG